jgi:hypothetical protein
MEHSFKDQPPLFDSVDFLEIALIGQIREILRQQTHTTAGLQTSQIKTNLFHRCKQIGK